ncbi:TIGR03620 family F420-dependent LLM class oxidoreductase [Mycobacterium sp. ACS4331]|uniref:TIGR03620 family F420-dependent LLM class oxidoreductase n=1 Tax=Mycobacterium sp. ACS4331 TaxID=1834121 RepID=UPI0007FD6472|nr:TIGR03620 family F420-dependent LLM class oxidoreductase [Mycobacterium sp. ACS4331]OBF25415.1 luciferase [Mycobacterium sp. ACS4331]
MTSSLPRGLGLWAGFLDRLPAADAAAGARELEAAGVTTIWLQEYSGVDPFIRAAFYLGATSRLTVALGVATIHARDPEAMVAAASTLHEAFPGRFVLGLGVSHRHLTESRGHSYRAPLETMRAYLADMSAVARRRVLPPIFLGALGPRMTELGAELTRGVHSYFSPVEHTAATRAAVGEGPWLAPTQLVCIGAAESEWRERAREYFGLCLGMPNYRKNLRRFGFSDDDLNSVADRLLDALAVPDEPLALRDRIAEHRAAGADHLVLQFIPPPQADVVLRRARDLNVFDPNQEGTLQWA